jgi:hypothetical protein
MWSFDGAIFESHKRGRPEASLLAGCLSLPRQECANKGVILPHARIADVLLDGGPVLDPTKSGFGTRARRNVSVPPLQMIEMLRRLRFAQAEKSTVTMPPMSAIKIRSADKAIVGQARIEPGKEMLKPKTPFLGQRRNLF